MKHLKYISEVLIIVCFFSCATYHYSGKMNEYFFKKKETQWKGFQTKECIVYYLKNSNSEKHLQIIEQKISKGLKKALTFSPIKKIKTPVYFFVVDNPNVLFELTNYPKITGVSFSKSNTIIESYGILGEAHEFFHLMSIQNWGETHTWIKEGVAVYSDEIWNRDSLHNISLKFQKNNQLIPLKELLKEHKIQKYSSAIWYPQSGSLVKYLIEKYGWEKFIQLWKTKNLQKTYSSSIEKIEKDWLETINSTKKK